MNEKYLTISLDVQESLRNYFEKGLHPGSYVMALIENDLRKAVFNAHPLELEHIKDALEYVDYVLGEINV